VAEPACQEHHIEMIYLLYDEYWDGMRDRPEFRHSEESGFREGDRTAARRTRPASAWTKSRPSEVHPNRVDNTKDL
jgi:hypothetical protein